jgi:outer membrane protein OmpA-like peptidoglycan-associated protein
MRLRNTLATVIAATGTFSTAFAQDVQNYKPATGTWNLLSVETAGTAEAGLFVPSLSVNFAQNPLVRRDANDEVTAKIVENLVGIDIGAVYGIHDRVELAISIPVGYASGEDIEALGDGAGEEGFGLGDIRAVPKVRILGGRKGSLVGLALSVPVSFPTGDAARGFGADTVVVNPKLALDLRLAGFTLALNGDQCPDEAEDKDGFEDTNGCPDADNDLDGLPDVSDACPNEAEDKDQFEDENGCPDPDNDNDGVLDGADQCVNEPEDKDGFEDENGCPDTDNDADGILDAEDKCPINAEDKDEFQDQDGCADPDNDNDGILDGDDKCPLKPESFNGVEDGDGCPDEGGKVKLTCEEITISEQVFFDTGKATIRKVSHDLLNQVGGVLQNAKFVTKVRVEGHTDAVKAYLVKKGIDGARLEPQGFGESQPVAPNDTEENMAKNRRVVFVVLENETCKNAGGTGGEAAPQNP